MALDRYWLFARGHRIRRVHAKVVERLPQAFRQYFKMFVSDRR